MKTIQLITISAFIFANSAIQAHENNATKAHETWMEEDNMPVNNIKPAKKHSSHKNGQNATHEGWMEEDNMPVNNLKPMKKHQHNSNAADKQEHFHESLME